MAASRAAAFGRSSAAQAPKTARRSSMRTARPRSSRLPLTGGTSRARSMVSRSDELEAPGFLQDRPERGQVPVGGRGRIELLEPASERVDMLGADQVPSERIGVDLAVAEDVGDRVERGAP